MSKLYKVVSSKVVGDNYSGGCIEVVEYFETLEQIPDTYKSVTVLRVKTVDLNFDPARALKIAKLIKEIEHCHEEYDNIVSELGDRQDQISELEDLLKELQK